MIRAAPSYAGSPCLLWHQIEPTDSDVGGRDPGGLRWKAHRRWLMEHVTRLHSEPESNTGAGQQRDLCREKRSDAYLESWGMSRHIRQGWNSLMVELLWQISCLKSPSCQTQRVLSQMFHHHRLMSGRWWLCRRASPSSFVLGAKSWCLHRWDGYMGNSEFCTSVAKSMELKLMYSDDRCVSQAINWDSLLISSWFLHEITLACSPVHIFWLIFFKPSSILSAVQDIAASDRLVLLLHLSLT